MVSRWQSKVVICKGGLVLDTDALTQGTVTPGSARILQNYEPALEGGYRRIDGYSKYDSAELATGSDKKVYGVKVAFSGVFAYADTGTSNDYRLHYSTGSGWADVSGAARSTTAPGKARFVSYYMGEERLVMVDGKDEAVRYNGTTSGDQTLIDGSGSGSGTPPADPKFCEYFLGRLCLAGYSSNPSAVTLSAPNDDLKFSGVDGAVEVNVGDIIVGIKTFRDTLYVFCRNSIYKIVEDVGTSFAVLDVAKSIGCIATDSIQELGGDLTFLAPDGLRSVAATERIGDIELALLSRRIQPFIKPLIASVTNDNFSSCTIRRKSQYRLFKFDSSITESSTLGVLGKLEPTEAGISYEWSTLKGIQPYCCDSFYDGSDEVVVFGHPSDGYVYQLESGNNFDGDEISAVYSSPQITFDDATIRKVLHKADIYTQVEGSIETDLSVLFDFQETDKIQPPSQTIATAAGGSTYGSAVYGTSSYGILEFPVFRKSLHGSGFTAAFKYTSSTSDKASHRIDSYQITYSPKGRK